MKNKVCEYHKQEFRFPLTSCIECEKLRKHDTLPITPPNTGEIMRKIDKRINNIINGILALLIAGLFVYLFIDPKGEVKSEREVQWKIDKATEIAEQSRRKVFCDEYRKIGISKDESAYAYKSCFK